MTAAPEITLAAAVDLARCEGLIALSGDRALCRAIRLVGKLPRDIAVAIHEAGHVAIAAALGHHVFGASIESDDADKLAGHALVGRDAESCDRPSAPYETDRRRAVKLAALANAHPTWRRIRRTIRGWRREVDALLVYRWGALLKLADELCWRGNMTEAEIAAVLEPGPCGIAGEDPRPEDELLIVVAGRVGERMALQGSEPGWVRMRRPAELRSFHEAAHCIVALSIGRPVYGVTIRPNPNCRCGPGGRISGGRTCLGERPDIRSAADIERRPARVPSDAERAALLALTLPLCDDETGPRWKTALRRIRKFRGRAGQLLIRNWWAVVKLAGELELHETLTADQIAAFTGRVAQPAGRGFP